jgi:hypothetical protein
MRNTRPAESIPEAHEGDYALMWSLLRFLKSTLVEHRKITASDTRVKRKRRIG